VLTREVEIIIERDPDEVWALVANPSSVLEWGPGLTNLVVDGSRRTATIEGMGVLEEEIQVNERERKFGYTITAAPFPLEHHRGWICVEPHAQGSRVRYGCDVAPDFLADPFATNMM